MVEREVIVPVRPRRKRVIGLATLLLILRRPLISRRFSSRAEGSLATLSHRLYVWPDHVLAHIL